MAQELEDYGDTVKELSDEGRYSTHKAERKAKGVLDFAVTALLNSMPIYTGAGGAIAIMTFITKMEKAIQAAQFNEQVALALAVNKLGGQAAILWLTHAKDNLPGSPRRWTTWSGLKDALNDHFFPREHYRAMEKTLTNLSQ
ncbi:MAG: hypothetical protein BJ554DRAFT_4929, partial [Olpidium bornovanus]